MGACKAAMVDRIKFIKINGYGSNIIESGEAVFTTIQMNNKIIKKMINFQLPPNLATLSDMP